MLKDKLINNFESIENSEKFYINEKDYMKDGIVYCYKCNTPKQSKRKALGREWIMPALCECQTLARDLEEKKRHEEETKREIERLKNAGFADHELKKFTFEADDLKNEKISKFSKNYAKDFKKYLKEGKGILFFGDVGTGKTYFACAIANELIEKGYTCHVTNFARVVNRIASTYDKQAIIDSLNSYQFLVIDDLAAERDTDYMNEIVWNVIDSRYRARKPIVITTNLTSAELFNPINVSKKRVYSRLLEMCIPVEVRGEDRRKKELNKNLQYYDELLKG